MVAATKGHRRMLNYFRAREACLASPGWNAFKSFMQTIVFWALFLAVIPSGIYALEDALELEQWRFPSTAAMWSGCVLFVLGGSLGLTSGAIMAIRGLGTPMPTDCARVLVIVGPYRYIRNPMALAGIAQGVAVGLILGSPAVIAYALTGGPVWNWFVRPWEEADLERRFGTPYRHYRQSIRCWLPSFPGYQPTNEAAVATSTTARSEA